MNPIFKVGEYYSILRRDETMDVKITRIFSSSTRPMVIEYRSYTKFCWLKFLHKGSFIDPYVDFKARIINNFNTTHDTPNDD